MAPEPLLRWIGFLYRIGPTRLRIEVVVRMRERHHPTLAEHDVEVELLRQLLVLPYREVPANRAQIAFSRGPGSPASEEKSAQPCSGPIHCAIALSGFLMPPCTGTWQPFLG